jgi:hypothetical protein
MTALIETAPKMDAAIEAMEHLVEEWRADHALDSPLFQRREPRDAASIDCRGVLAALPRTSIEPLGLAVEGVVPPGGTGPAVLHQGREVGRGAAVAPARERSGEGPGCRRRGPQGRRP